MNLNLTQRYLDSVTFAEGGIGTVKLPRDCFIHSLDIRIVGNVTTTFASGTPLTAYTAVMDVLLTDITVKVNNRTVKAVRPWLQRMNNLLVDGVAPRQTSSAGAAAVSPIFNQTTGAQFTYGTTTQITSFQDGIRIDFFLPEKLADKGYLTLLNTKTASSAELKFTMGSFASIERTQTLVVAFSASTVNIYTTANVVDLPAETPTYDYRQSYFKDQITAAATSRKQDINTGNILIGLGLFVESNNNKTTSVEGLNFRNNLGILSLGFEVNGVQYIIDPQTPWVQKQQEMIKMFKIAGTEYASAVSIIDGFVYFNFVNNKDMFLGLNLLEARSAKFVYTSGAALASSPYLTYPITTSIESHEICQIAA